MGSGAQDTGDEPGPLKGLPFFHYVNPSVLVGAKNTPPRQREPLQKFRARMPIWVVCPRGDQGEAWMHPREKFRRRRIPAPVVPHLQHVGAQRIAGRLPTISCSASFSASPGSRMARLPYTSRSTSESSFFGGP